MTNVSDPQLSPDGHHIAYVVGRVDEEANTYRSQIWVVPTDQTAPPRALTLAPIAMPIHAGAPTADSSHSAQAGQRCQGQDPSTLHLLPFGVPGETITLAEGNESFGQLAFSPTANGSPSPTAPAATITTLTRSAAAQLARSSICSSRSTARVSSPTAQAHLCRAHRRFSRPAQCHTGSARMSSPAWFPDSERLAFGLNRRRTDFAADVAIADITATPAEGEAPYELLTNGTGSYDNPMVTADGGASLLADSTTHSGTRRTAIWACCIPARLLHLTGSPSPSIAPGCRSSLAKRPCGRPDGSIVAAVEDRGNTHLYRMSLDEGSTPQPVLIGDLNITGYSAGDLHGSNVIAYTATKRDQPAELYVYVDGKTTQLTTVSASFLAKTQPRSW